MFFYRAMVVEAQTRDELYREPCPICGGKLSADKLGLPIRYSPMVLFRFLSFAGALAILLLLLLYRCDPVTMFLNQFAYRTQKWLIAGGLAAICLPAAFFVIWAELRVGHLSQDDKLVCGCRCKTCGNGFAGLIAYEPERYIPGNDAAPKEASAHCASPEAEENMRT